MMFLLVTLCIISLIYGYIGWRIIIPSQISPIWKRLSWLLLIVFMLSPIISILLRSKGLETYWVDILAWIGYLSLGFLLLVFTFLAIKDIFRLFSKSVTLIQDYLGSKKKVHDKHDPDRRAFMSYSANMGILGISGSLTGYGFIEARRKPSIVDVSVPIENLHEDLEGFRIVQLTDIHVGPTVKREYVKTIVEMANSLAPDIIAITGDLTDGSVNRLRKDVSPLADLSATYGCYFVTGNHEYYSGANAWIDELSRLGINVLMNEHNVIEKGSGKILLAGVTDYRAGQYLQGHASDPEAAISGAPSCHCKILLAHQPRSIYAAAESGFDLQISGHTHGGQFFPWNYFVYLAQPFVSDLNKFKDTWIYVSKGTGYWGPPLRLGADSEITLIKLTRQDSPA